MSIPPLVCSTPPPPDQCEDDKDPEDFEIQYNLSQDDEEDNYDFGGFCTYNHYQPSQINPNEDVAKKIETEIKDDSIEEHKNITENDLKQNTTIENKDNFDEEINIEDLNLEGLKEQQDAIERVDVTETDVDAKTSEPSQDIVKANLIPGTSTDTDSPCVLTATEFVIEPSSIDQLEEPPSYVDEIIAAVNNLQFTPTEPDVPFDNIEISDPIPEHITETERNDNSVVPEDVIGKHEQEKNADADFSDFDDFQFISPVDKPSTVIGCDNPWDKSDVATDNDFGDFKANFDENESNILNSFFVKPDQEVIPADKFEASSSAPIQAPEDDDFGDFNDFQSSSADVQLEADSDEILQFPVLDLRLDDDKLMESITGVINSIFEDDIPDPLPEDECGEKLESVLGITWGHLLQVDERQPYMVNWNNTLGQKTLLKALCIDSRNILFAPKWNFNMPKYAATLSAAPLQPQKQVSSLSTASHTEASHTDKSTGKPAGTWSDPFSSDGQESCNPDSAPENPVIETGPTDLDVFEASTSSKPDKIFSSTLNVQPLRQISLPDTHIFTPTDSETPRSTTIHYDNSPTVLMPQTVIETNKSEARFKSDSHNLPNKEEEYDWEFQDFKGPSKTDTSIATSKLSYGTQVLQPVKVEPIMPTLNWPDPGDVKETFDDFTDFVSSSSLSNNLQQTPTVPVQKINIKPTNIIDNVGLKPVATSKPNVTHVAGDDDDFDTFQSALPSSSSADFNFSSLNKVSSAVSAKPNISPQAPPSIMTDFSAAFPKVENVKSDTISTESMNKTKDIFPSNLEVKNQASSSSAMSTGLLQPTLASSSATVPSQKSAQILQPLSLESFSQINWPNPGIDLHDLSRFNPVETLNSLKSDLSVNSQSKVASPVYSQKNTMGTTSSQLSDDDWGEFVSSTPKPQQQPMPKNQTTYADDEWTDFVSSPSVKPQNGLSTISLNVHTNFQSKPSKISSKGNKVPLEIPTLNYITPKSSSHKTYNDRHFQNL